MGIEPEDFLDRMRRQAGWELSLLPKYNLVLCGSAPSMMRTLSFGALSCGLNNQAFIGPREEMDSLARMADGSMNHLGLAAAYIPVYSLGFSSMKRHWIMKKPVWIIDAGDARYDPLAPGLKEFALYYAQGRGIHEKRWLAFGTDRARVAYHREGCPVSDRAEISALCAHLLIGMMAALNVCADLEPIDPLARIPIPNIPQAPQVPPSFSLYAGGGGAIAHQELWAESLDPVLRESNQKGRMIVVDPKPVHDECCRSRQWGYGPDALGEAKALLTARWLETLFPGVEVHPFVEKLKEDYFHDYPLKEAFSSLDNWTGRRLLADLADEYGVPWWSSGSSFLGGFARQVSGKNPYCASAYHGVERLGERGKEAEEGASCSAPSTPLPSSVLPQMVLGSFMASMKRELLLGRADRIQLARGIEVHLAHTSEHPDYGGLRFSPGRRLNLRKCLQVED